MAWAVKYRCEVQDISGGVNWVVDIEEDAFEGSITYLTGDSDPIRFVYENRSDDVFDAIKESQLILTVKATTDFLLADLYSVEDLQFRVRAYANTALKWLGYIITGNYSEPYEDTPFPVTITASCGLKHLEQVLFDDAGTYYNGRILESEVIIEILGKIGHTGFTEYVNIYEGSMIYSVDDSPMDQIKIDVDIFRDRYCDEVLNEILKKYGAVILHKNGTFSIYRPVELVGATVYGRIFTAATTKSSTSFTPLQEINRSGHASTILQIPGGAMMIQRPAAKVGVYQDYGNKESWIDNYELKANSIDIFNNTVEAWTNTGIIVLPMGYADANEVDGVVLVNHNNMGAPDKWISQSFAPNAKATNNLCSLSVEILTVNFNNAAETGIGYYIEIKADDGDYWLELDAYNIGQWVAAQAYVIITHDSPIGSSGWEKISIPINGLPLNSAYTIKLLSGSIMFPLIDVAFKNIMFTTTSDNIDVKITKSLSYLFPKRRLFGEYTYTRERILTDVAEIVSKAWEGSNAINGVRLEYDMFLGDATDTNNDNTVEQLAGTLARIGYSGGVGAVARVDEITKNNVAADTLVTINGYFYTMVWNTDEATSCADFVSAYGGSFGDITLTHTPLDGFFVATANVAGVDFIGTTSIVEGGVNTTTANDPGAGGTEILISTMNWNTRGNTEDNPLLEIIKDEITFQYSRPKQFIQFSLFETGSSVSVINLLGRFEDELNQISAVNRKFVFNRGEWSARFRKYMIDLIEIIE